MLVQATKALRILAFIDFTVIALKFILLQRYAHISE